MSTPRPQRIFHPRWMARLILIFMLLSSSSIAPSYSTDEMTATPPPSLEGLALGWQTCSSHQTCTECYGASHTCHWCAHDNACHVKGSVSGGCVTGASCGTADDPKSKSCFDHTTCADCSSSSWGCHWCSSDEACHAVGSMHGCAAGADCYAIGRCQRLEPERTEYGGLFSKASYQGVGPVAKGLLGVLTGLALCCSTLCFAGATLVKCTVDDLVGEPVEIVEDGMLMGETEGLDQLEIPLLKNDDANGDGAEEGGGNSAEGAINDPGSDPVWMRSGAALSSASNRATPRGSSIGRMFHACQLCYLATVLTTVVLFTVGMAYAPRQPQYNVCTNQVAWKSIVEGMTSLKMSASFDLLISVHNPNRFEVDLSHGHGQFHHDDQYVGSFDIPGARISGRAISDIVVKATFTPDKWSALALTSEYYQGKLAFIVGGHAHVKIPGLGNYNFDAKFDDIHVNVNDPSLDDTHLCACPGWKKP